MTLNTENSRAEVVAELRGRIVRDKEERCKMKLTNLLFLFANK